MKIEKHGGKIFLVFLIGTFILTGIVYFNQDVFMRFFMRIQPFLITFMIWWFAFMGLILFLVYTRPKSKK